jgi:hypothetical protein
VASTGTGQGREHPSGAAVVTITMAEAMTTMADATTRRTAVRPPAARVIRDLYELIAAIDRRVPQVARSGEASIASAAAALRAEATKRIAELERESTADVVSTELD